MRLQVSFYLLNKLCFPVIRMVFPAFEAFQGRLTKNLQEMNNPEVQTPRPKQRAGTESRAGLRRGGGRRGHPRVGRCGPARTLHPAPGRWGFGGVGATPRLELGLCPAHLPPTPARASPPPTAPRVTAGAA